MSESDAGLDGYSLPLCSKIVHTLWSREEKFHIRTTCVLGHNTKRDSDGNTYPIFNGFVVSFCKNCYSLFFCAIITRVFILLNGILIYYILCTISGGDCNRKSHPVMF